MRLFRQEAAKLASDGFGFSQESIVPKNRLYYHRGCSVDIPGVMRRDLTLPLEREQPVAVDPEDEGPAVTRASAPATAAIAADVVRVHRLDEA